IWVHDLARGVRQRVTKNPSLEVSPVWSRDGRRIYYSSGRLGKYDIYSVDAAADGAETLVYSSDENKFVTSTTPGGDLIFDSRTSSGTSDIRILRPGGRPPEPLVQTAANESFGVVSPDGKALAWVSDESGITEVYVGAFPPVSAGAGKVVV